jgi:hypothetical protein
MTKSAPEEHASGAVPWLALVTAAIARANTLGGEGDGDGLPVAAMELGDGVTGGDKKAHREHGQISTSGTHRPQLSKSR